MSRKLKKQETKSPKPARSRFSFFWGLLIGFALGALYASGQHARFWLEYSPLQWIRGLDLMDHSSKPSASFDFSASRPHIKSESRVHASAVGAGGFWIEVMRGPSHVILERARARLSLEGYTLRLEPLLGGRVYVLSLGPYAKKDEALRVMQRLRSAYPNIHLITE